MKGIAGKHHRIFIISVLGIAWIFAGCRRAEYFPEVREFSIADSQFVGSVRFDKLHYAEGFRIAVLDSLSRIVDQKHLRFPAYRFDIADVDHDGRTDIIVGVVKRTRFDPSEQKRLFILQIEKGHIRPMWLGSRVRNTLVDFQGVPDGSVRTLEMTKGGYLVGLYQWRHFGLHFQKYLNNAPYDLPSAEKAFAE